MIGTQWAGDAIDMAGGVFVDNSSPFLFRRQFILESTGALAARSGPSAITVTGDSLTAEILSNTTYEASLGGWTQTAGDGAITRDTPIAHGGTYSAKLTAGATANTNIVVQVNVVPGRTYTFSFWTYGDGTNAGRYQVYDKTHELDLTAITPTGVTASGWSQVPVTVIPPPGCYYVYLYLWCPAANGGSAWFDDVSFQVTNPTGMLTNVAGKGALFAYGTKAWGATRIVGTTPFPLKVGEAAQFQFVMSGGPFALGWSNSAGTGATLSALYFSGNYIFMVNNTTTSTTLQVAYYPYGVTYGHRYTATIQRRSSGMYFYIQGGPEYPFPTLLFVSTAFAVDPAYLLVYDYAGTFALESMGVLKPLALPSPLLAYTPVGKADGAATTTDTTGPDTQPAPSSAWPSALTVASQLVAGPIASCVNLGTAEVLGTCDLTYVSGYLNGVYTLADGAAGGTNRIEIRSDGAGNILVVKVVAGTPTTLGTTAHGKSAGQTVNVQWRHRQGYLYVFVGGVLATSAPYTVPATIYSGGYHGYYSNDATATLGALAIWATTSSRYPQPALATSYLNITCMGDSKSTTNYFKFLCDRITDETFYGSPVLAQELPQRYAVGGMTTTILANTLVANVLGAAPFIGDPTHEFLNIGVNDFDQIRGGTLSQATHQTLYLQILDAIHTAYPHATVWCTLPGKLNYDAEAATIAGWIRTCVGLRLTFARVGDDEAIWLKNGADNYTTYTSDGTHPNTAGQLLCAQVRAALIGY